MAETTLPQLFVSKEEALLKIQTQIEKGRLLRDQDIRSYYGLKEPRMECQKWSEYNEILLSRLFDNTSIVEDVYIRFSEPQPKPYRGDPKLPPSFSEYLDSYRKGMDCSINSLEGIRDQLKPFDESLDMPQCTSDDEDVSNNSTRTVGTDIFIIHGRDDGAKGDVALFLRDLGLKEIILDRQPNEGLIAILDKFEREAKKADLAIALLTPDDVGALKGEADDQLKPRARQNVIFELGYFIKALGREKVCLLLKGDLENPSDLNGIFYVPITNPNEWQLQLAKEMKQAGLPIDLNKLAEDR